MITTKNIKILNRLIKFAMNNQPNRRKHFSAIKCGKSIFYGENSYEKGSTDATKEGYKFPYPHAEYNIASKFNDITELYVIRINKRNELIDSNPCEACRNYLFSRGVKSIIYSTVDGFKYEKLT